jgi:hypothetical protein
MLESSSSDGEEWVVEAAVRLSTMLSWPSSSSLPSGDSVGSVCPCVELMESSVLLASIRVLVVEAVEGSLVGLGSVTLLRVVDAWNGSERVEDTNSPFSLAWSTSDKVRCVPLTKAVVISKRKGACWTTSMGDIAITVCLHLDSFDKAPTMLSENCKYHRGSSIG